MTPPTVYIGFDRHGCIRIRLPDAPELAGHLPELQEEWARQGLRLESWRVDMAEGWVPGPCRVRQETTP